MFFVLLAQHYSIKANFLCLYAVAMPNSGCIMMQLALIFVKHLFITFLF